MASFKLIACVERKTGDTFILFKVFDYVSNITYATIALSLKPQAV